MVHDLKFSINKFLLILVIAGCGLYGFDIISKAFSQKQKYTVDAIKFTQYKGNLLAVAIIGAGPAGCASAIYSARYGLPTAVFGYIGGQLMGTGIVENYPGILSIQGPDLMYTMQRQAELHGALFIEKKVIKIDTTSWPYALDLEDGSRFYALTVIMTTGSTPNRLNCPGESEYWGKGVTTCAVCDAPLYANKEVVVVGGGDSACEEAMQLAHYASKISVLVRSDKMRASTIMKKRIEQEPKITILYNTKVVEIIGDENKVTSVMLDKNGVIEEQKIDGVFIAIGHSPNTSLVSGLVDMDDKGLIKCKGNSQQTSLAGLFAAGDIENDYNQAAIAVGNGVKATMDAYDFILHAGVTDSICIKNKASFFQDNSIELDKNNQSENQDLDVEVHKDQDIESNQMDADKNETIRSLPKVEEPAIATRSFMPGIIVEIHSMQDLQAAIARKESFVLDLYTERCPACKVLKNVLHRYTSSKDQSVTVYGADVSLARDIGVNFNVSSVPMIILYKNGIKAKQRVGSMEYSELIKWINS